MNKKITIKMILALAAVSYSDASANFFTSLFRGGEKVVQESAEAGLKKVAEAGAAKSLTKSQMKKEISAIEKKAATLKKEDIEEAIKVAKNEFESDIGKIKSLKNELKTADKMRKSQIQDKLKVLNTKVKTGAETAILKGEKNLKELEKNMKNIRINAEGAGGLNDTKDLTDVAKIVSQQKIALKEMKTIKANAEKGLSPIGLTKNQTIAAAGVGGAAVGAGTVGVVMANKKDSGAGTTERQEKPQESKMDNLYSQLYINR